MAKANPLALAVTAARSRTQQHQSDAPATRTGKAKSAEYRQLSVYVPREMHTRLKVAAAEDGREMSDVVATLLFEWLNIRKSK